METGDPRVGISQLGKGDKPSSIHPILHFEGEEVEDKDNSMERESEHNVE